MPGEKKGGLRAALERMEASVRDLPMLPTKSTLLRNENKRLKKLFPQANRNKKRP
jgi:hypothetical protein|tara:strand:- start:2298 stop:2462 length:165 start_codon:yes stop_codon:yes gene_type:complete